MKNVYNMTGRPGPKGPTGAKGGVGLMGLTGPTGPANFNGIDVFGNTGSAEGMAFQSNLLRLLPATNSFPGGVSMEDQTMGDGVKTFQKDIIGQGNLILDQTTAGGTGVIYFGNGTRIHDFSQYSGVKNFFAGMDSGNYTMSGSYNIGIGTEAGSNITSGGSNLILGHGTSSLTSGQFNTFLGGGSNITTGNRNLIAGGIGPGNNYNDIESDNICLSNKGVLGDQNKIRIGDPTIHNGCFVAGIIGNTLSNPQFMTIDVNNQLGATGDINGLMTTGNQTFSGTKTFDTLNANTMNVGSTSTEPDVSFPNNVKNRKISLYLNADNDHQYYGFGININMTRYQVATTGSDHVFYAATSTTASNELFRIKGTGGIQLPTSGGTVGTLDYYEKSGFTTTFTCGSTTTGPITCQFERIGSTVSMRIPTLGASFTTAGVFTSNQAFYTRWRPAQTTQWPAVVTDNSVPGVLGRVQINNGTIQISVGSNQGNFTGGGIGWPAALCYTWTIL